MVKLIAIGALAAALTTWSGGETLASATPSPSPAVATQTQEQPVEWNVFAVGVGETSLDLVSLHGVCGSIRAGVRETRTSVAIEVVEVHEGPALLCPAVAIIGPLGVQLKHPLAGRPIQGLSQHGLHLGPAKNFGVVPLGVMPRVIGFAPQDAAHALELFSLRDRIKVVRRTIGLRRVVAQYPAPGHPVPASRVVRLSVAGH